MEQDVTLRELVDAKLAAAAELVDTKLAALTSQVLAAFVCSEKAVTKAEVATEKRFDSVNEFRKALSDQATEFLPRGEYNVQHKALADRVEINSTRVAEIEAGMIGSRQGSSSFGAIIIGIMMSISTMCSIVAVLVAIWHK